MKLPKSIPLSYTPEKKQYGVFIWRGDGRYKKSDAIRLCVSWKNAEKYMSTLDQDSEIYVVRET